MGGCSLVAVVSVSAAATSDNTAASASAVRIDDAAALRLGRIVALMMLVFYASAADDVVSPLQLVVCDVFHKMFDSSING